MDRVLGPVRGDLHPLRDQGDQVTGGQGALPPWKNPVPADDAIRVHARDDEIVISFEKGEEPPW